MQLESTDAEMAYRTAASGPLRQAKLKEDDAQLQRGIQLVEEEQLKELRVAKGYSGCMPSVKTQQTY